MIVSHKFKLIFIHIPKNAGTFILKLLKKYDPFLVEYYNYSSRKTLHNKAKDIDSILNFNYSDYKIFCIIRNPFDRLVSLYSYICGNSDYPTYNIVKNMSFKEFIAYKFSNKDFLHTNYINQYQFLDVKVSINIIRYEFLKTELNILFKSVNLIINEKEYDIIINNSKKNIDIDISNIKEFILQNIPDIKKELEIFNYK